LAGLAAGFGWLLLTATPGLAVDPAAPDQTLRKLERDLSAGRDRQSRLERQSLSLRADLQALRARLVAASDAASRQQADLADIESTLARSEADERTQSASLASRRREIAELSGALYRLSLTPPEALIVRPEAPVDALRTALLLQQALPLVRQRADAVAAAIGRIHELRRRLETERNQVRAARAAMATRLAEIGDLVAQREALARETDTERQQNAQRIAALIAQASDLRQLFERLEAERRSAAERPHPEPPPLPPIPPDPSLATAPTPSAHSEPERVTAAPRPAGGEGWRLPAAGRVALTYGDTDRFGTTSRGVHIAAPSGTPVVAPFEGTIRFAGTFRAYGQILIVEHINGYHSLIAGLGRIDTGVGRTVSAGEPVGVVAEPGTDGIPDLYFELRRNGQPVNPRRGIPGLDGKGQG
jgi:septal ring factor EnvC (AmiA/AmiB activator)